MDGTSVPRIDTPSESPSSDSPIGDETRGTDVPMESPTSRRSRSSVDGYGLVEEFASGVVQHDNTDVSPQQIAESTGKKLKQNCISEANSQNHSSPELSSPLQPLKCENNVSGAVENDSDLEEAHVGVTTEEEPINLPSKECIDDKLLQCVSTSDLISEKTLQDKMVTELPAFEAMRQQMEQNIAKSSQQNSTEIDKDEVNGKSENLDFSKVEEGHLNGSIFTNIKSSTEIASRSSSMNDTEDEELNPRSVGMSHVDFRDHESSGIQSNNLHKGKEVGLAFIVDGLETATTQVLTGFEHGNLHGIWAPDESKDFGTETAEQLQYLNKTGPEQRKLADDTLLASLVSSEMEGWHHFDVEGQFEDNLASVHNSSMQQFHEPELWEQLLDSGLQKEAVADESLAVEPGHPDKLLPDQHWQESLASPGNPFIDGLERLSNFSETEFFGSQEEQIALTPTSETRKAIALPSEGNLESTTNDKGSSVSEEKQQDSNPQLRAASSSISVSVGDKAKKVSMPLLDEKHSSSVDSTDISVQPTMEMFEAPSFMSLVDPEAHELMKAAMPLWVDRNKAQIVTQPPGSGNTLALNEDPSIKSHSQCQKPLQILFSREKKWDDLMDSLASTQLSPTLSPQGATNGLPSPEIAITPSQDITSRLSPGGIQNSSKGKRSSQSPGTGRSLSLTGLSTWSPKSTSTSKGLTPSSSPKKNLTPSLSPQTSPFLKKFVQKVRSKPAAARELASSKNATTKAKSKSMWSTCMCCSSVN